jgi:hypothetical protein
MHVSKMTQHLAIDKHKFSQKRIDFFENSLIKEQIVKGGAIPLSLPNQNISQIKKKTTAYEFERHAGNNQRDK